ncbi:trimeric intracellular cation channel family protein [Curtobacterium sp. S6]|uniref:trimeric intracellular cation channel family protein n=1 Tax=Curtobacterium sp. S6 TaxID=1479623 RepID=UPI0004AA7A7E|nr:TRIC cation channel family protein [Curtobacterium sp. S6]
MNEWDPSLWFRVVDIAAVVANGLLGGAVARGFRFDVVGFVMLAILSGTGGGLIRDILLNTGFPIALTDSGYWIGVAVAATIAYTLDLGASWANRFLTAVDFIGMGCWVATGTAKGLGLGLHWVPSILLGVTTAVGGGILRDIMVNRIPSVLGGSSLYATVGVIGAAEMAFFSLVLHMESVGMGVSILTCGVVGILARWRNWQLPAPVTLKVTVPRPSFDFRRRPRFRARRAGDRGSSEPHSTTSPLTQNLDQVTEEQVRAHRNQKRRHFRDDR